MSKDSNPIVVEQTFHVPVREVWKAITVPDEMRQWYFEMIPDFKPEVGFETAFDVECEGVVYPHLWKVTEVVPDERIAYDWRFGGYPGESVVTWEISATPDGSHLKLTHTGGQSFPQDVEVFRRESCEAGWKYFLQDRLPAYLNRRD